MIWTSPSRTGRKRDTTQAAGTDKTPLRTLASFLKAASNPETPTLLDLGPALGSNIEFFGRQGFKIFVEDFLRNHLDRSHDSLGDSKPLNYPDGSFDGILCWDIFDFMEPREAAALLRHLCRLLKEKGLIIALFDARPQPQARALVHYRISGNSGVIHEPIAGIRSRVHHHPNREIMKLFHRFTIIKSYFHKSNLREYLFQKKPEVSS
ncbi:MAG: class I SAM-dependent methyltransferase [bacterium]|nr:class I SAM-dependent methyltransferase [bacterium]